MVYIQSGFTGIKMLKEWLKENGFITFPVVPWKNGIILDEMHEKGFTIKAIIGSPQIIESAKKHRPLAFSFQEAEDAVEVKSWEEIRKRLK